MTQRKTLFLFYSVGSRLLSPKLFKLLEITIKKNVSDFIEGNILFITDCCAIAQGFFS